MFNSINTQIIKGLYPFYSLPTLTKIASLILILIVFYVLLTAYFKIKYRFWSIQPVFHIHNLIYWFNPPGIINKNNYQKHHLFFNDLISFKNYQNINTTEKKALTNLIENHFYRTSLANYQPGNKGLHTYFIGHNSNSFISYLFNYDSTNSQMIGAITSRPCLIWIRNNSFPLYYVDFLCVDKNHRKKNIAPQLIHTHTYHHKLNTSNQVLLFKREGPQTLIMPLTLYNSYYYDVSHWLSNKLENNRHIYLIDSKNFKSYFDIHTSLNEKFTCFSTTYIGNIKELIEHKIIYIVVLEIDNIVKGIIYCRNSFTKYHDNIVDKTINLLEIFGSLFESDISYTEIYHFLQYTVQLINIKENYNGLIIENIGHNHKLLKPMFKNECYKKSFQVGWYLYNYAEYPIKSNEVFIIY
jgi:hypothetical protein